MSTPAKYGWAIGLIFAGIVGALPFRHNGDHSSGPTVAQNDETQESENDKPRPKNPASKDADNAKDGDRSLAKSNLLPDAGNSIDQFDNQHRFEQSSPSARQSNSFTGQGQIVEQVPNRLDRQSVPLNKNAAEGSGVQEPSKRPAQLKPVQLDQPKIRREMPRNVGPYRMKPVPTSKFHPASQSDQRDVISSPVHRTRKVVQYKLRDGDSLRSIAQRYLGDANRFEEILNDNQHILTNGESFLPVGQFITIVIQ